MYNGRRTAAGSYIFDNKKKPGAKMITHTYTHKSPLFNNTKETDTFFEALADARTSVRTGDSNDTVVIDCLYQLLKMSVSSETFGTKVVRRKAIRTFVDLIQTERGLDIEDMINMMGRSFGATNQELIIITQ